jgi:carbamoyltransferase
MPVTTADYSYMTFVLQVRDSARAELAAVTHVDGTARIQSVSRLSEPQYWELIREFESLTGIPAILNTSFNNNAEPIVDSVEDAIVCFLTTDIDVLVMSDYIIRKRKRKRPGSSYTSLRPSLRYSRKLVKRTWPEAGEVVVTYHLEATASRHFVETQIELSKDMFSVLLASDGCKTLADLYVQTGVPAGARRRALTEEIDNLWSRRAIVLRP